jgi:uncharacterized membrane protein YeaQ/YmgE (transglycosylase-associated protein family)
MSTEVDESGAGAGGSVRGASGDTYAQRMLIIALILFGMLVGAAAQLILGKGSKGIDWTMAFVAGLVGSFVGGLIASLLAGDGLELRPSGIIGSIVGAVIVTAIWRYSATRRKVG